MNNEALDRNEDWQIFDAGIDRRQFLRSAAKFGLSASMLGFLARNPFVQVAHAAGASGGSAKITVAMPGGRMSGPMSRSGAAWAQKNGVDLTVVQVPGGQVYEKVLTELAAESGAFDVVLYPPGYNGDFVGGGFLIPLDNYLMKAGSAIDEDYDKGGVQWGQQLLPHREINPWYVVEGKWDGKPHVFDLNIDGDMHMGFYRKDLWQKFGKEFADKHGYELRVEDPWFPETWDQYYDIAAFFQNKDIGGGQIIWGHTDINVRSRASTWHFLWRYSTRLLHVSDENMRNGDIYFEKESMEPLISNEAGVAAMEDVLKSASSKYSPPNAKGLGWSDMQGLWETGKISMGVTWPAMSKIAADPERWKIPGGMADAGSFILPGVEEVYDTAKKSWVKLSKEQYPKGRRMPALAWGWGYAITATNRHPDLSWDLIRWCSTGDRVRQVELAQGEEYEAHMDWQYTDPAIMDFYKQDSAWLVASKQSQLLGVPDLRIPGAVPMYDAIEIHKGEALDGSINAKEAVNRIANDWRSIIKQGGFDSAKRAYANTTQRRTIKDLSKSPVQS
jgi:multiple sugar transport system substrate-binding protein